MMQGTLFTGKITVRFDKDGIPTTRGPGDMTSEYKKILSRSERRMWMS